MNGACKRQSDDLTHMSCTRGYVITVCEARRVVPTADGALIKAAGPVTCLWCAAEDYPPASAAAIRSRR